MSKKFALFGIGIAAILAFAIGGWMYMQEGNEAELSYRTYPIADLPFEILGEDFGEVGNSRSAVLADFSAELRIVTSWATWCARCAEQFGYFAELKKEFGEKIAIIAVNRDEPVHVQEQFISANNLRGQGIVFLLDSGDELYEKIGGYDMPETVFLGPENDVRYHKRSIMTLEEMRMHTQEALQK